MWLHLRDYVIVRSLHLSMIRWLTQTVWLFTTVADDDDTFPLRKDAAALFIKITRRSN